MPYKPKFCCQCGEKIERVDWKLLTSRRFCELCATEYGVYDKLPLIVVSISLLFGLYGIGNYLRTPEKTLNIAPNRFVGGTGGNEISRANPAVQISSDTSVPAPLQTKTETISTKQNSQPERTETTAQEAVYICGAMTKKGSPCSRRVKNGGRCWQHEGKAAMLPAEKLLVRK